PISRLSLRSLRLSRRRRSTSPSPYTTLFRSRTGATSERRVRDRRGPGRHPRRGLAAGPFLRPDRPRLDPALAQHALPRECDPLSDRKSTRLNSSHVKISYAVFCLKKTSERRP